MTNYSRGADTERRVAEMLRAEGYEVIRSAGSHGAADLAAFKPGATLLIQVTRGRKSADDLARLHDMAVACGAVPILAVYKPRQPLNLTRVVLGPSGWLREPYRTDLVA